MKGLLLASLAFAIAGCSVAAAPVPARPPAAPSTPLLPIERANVASPVAPPGDHTLAGEEVATLLRHVALVRAVTESDAYLATYALTAVWEDSEQWPDALAARTLLDGVLRAHPSKDLLSASSSLRADVARSWLDRGDVPRARAMFETLPVDEVPIRVELAAALDGRAAADRIAGASDGEIAPEDVHLAVVEGDARWGDADRAAKQIDALEPTRACLAAVAVAERRRRDGRLDAGRWLDVAEASLAAQTAEQVSVSDCAVALVRALYRMGDADRIPRVLEAAKTWPLEEVCSVTYRTFDAIPASLLEPLVLVAARSEADIGAGPWEGCAAVMAELAARRGDRALAQRFLNRERGDFGDYGGDDEPSPDFAWSARVRLGRADALEPGILSEGVFDVLLVARFFEEHPDARVDLAVLLAALSADERDEGDAAEDGGRPEKE